MPITWAKFKGHALEVMGGLVTPLNIPLCAATIFFRCPSVFLMSCCVSVTQHWDWVALTFPNKITMQHKLKTIYFFKYYYKSVIFLCRSAENTQHNTLWKKKTLTCSLNQSCLEVDRQAVWSNKISIQRKWGIISFVLVCMYAQILYSDEKYTGIQD